MGLDMLLYEVPKGVSFKNADEFFNYPSSFITWATWRNARSIHYWFLDKCKPIEYEVLYEVTRDDIYDLIRDCAEVLKDISKADALIPNLDGWNDEFSVSWYKGQLVHTIHILGKTLDKSEEDSQFYYHASW